MPLNLHSLKSVKNGKSKKRLGRGHGSGKGTFAGRGLKGQKARAGGRGGLKLKGMKANLQNIPKLPGFNSLQAKMEVVNLSQLETHFDAGQKVSPETLKKKGLVETTENGVKILGNGALTKKLIVVADKVSASAKVAIEKAGGSVSAFGEKKEKPKKSAE